MKVLLLIGIPGCGKTTFYKKFLPGLARISRDDIGDRKKELEIIEEYLRKGCDFVIDDINHSKESRSKIISMAKRFDAEITGIFFDFSIDRCLFQNFKRESPLPGAAIGKWNKLLEPPSEGEGFVHIQRLDDNFKF